MAARTFRFDTADVATDPALAFGVLTYTAPADRADEVAAALVTLGFAVSEDVAA